MCSVVYYRNDDMDDWELLADGLPNVVISELEILKNGTSGNPELYISTFGRGIWKTDALQDVMVSTDHYQAFDWEIQLLPTINRGDFMIMFSGEISGESCQIQVIDQMGRIVYHQEVFVSGNELNIPISLEVLSGQYYVRTVKGGTVQVKKVMIVD